ncbi:flavin-binding monooxygenas [Pyrenophora tritici-repentis Pt-1C-BFP]|uniref:Flavin-binding monooxygenas n=1 Tax=Pyrenophora tritici-repentis (strain Pt-1C-BFP) TaxID=426418 RepID=B2W916_PYRTR|nr:flavin-binding monooxygenas [Pyrenophora tritici-repentis Pt-1C-BFP]EDU49394.1 flavin-binding monooxygenas [Pyrenophora tritici-repentis Pt-1C-BFP]
MSRACQDTVDSFTLDYVMSPNPVIPAADKVTPEAKTATSKQRVAQLTGHLTPPAEKQNVNNHPNLNIPYPVSKFQIDPNRYIDNVREIKVAVIGAGLSGISAGIILPAKVPGLKLTIFEKNSDVSGTWLENNYPGVRCDIPAHVYQSTFSPNTQWSEIFAQGAEIRDYWQAQARKHDVYKYIKLRHRVDEAEWDGASSQWSLKVQDLEKEKVTTESFDFVITAIGRFNAWKLPDYPGLDEFQGHLRHTSNWDPSFDPRGKKVAVIGNGASGIQVVPNLQLVSKQVTHFLVKTPIKRFTQTGIETVDGKNFDFDAILCATGANTDLVPPFPIKAHGEDLNKSWKPDGQWGFPYTYMGIATPGFPNLFFLAGPHATGPSGTVPQAVETALAYFAKAFRKASSQGIKAMWPSKEATDDFIDYCDAFFPTTVLTDNCSSWNNGGLPGQRIHGLWPGSAAHITIVRREPRWEDWEYEREDKLNRFAYFGNGYTQAELDESRDLTAYLRPPQEVDLKDLHEKWWDLPGAQKKS